MGNAFVYAHHPMDLSQQPRDYVQEDLDRHASKTQEQQIEAGLRKEAARERSLAYEQSETTLEARQRQAQQGWQCVVCGKGNAPHAVLCGNPVCGLDFSHAR